jgi:hypothetical protein
MEIAAALDLQFSWRGGSHLGRVFGQRRQLVDDNLGPGILQSLLDGSHIEGAQLGDSRPYIGEVPRPRLGTRHPRNFMATADQLGDERLADRSARPGDEDLHGSLIPRPGS